MGSPALLPWASLAGLWTGAVVSAPAPTAWLALAAGGAGLCARRGRLSALVAVACLAFGCGALRSATAEGDEVLAGTAATVPYCDIEGTVGEQLGGLGTLVFVREARCRDHAVIENAGRVVVDGTLADTGSEIRASGYLLPLRDVGFDGARRRLGAGAELDTGTVEVVRGPRGVMGVAAAVRRGLRRATSGLAADRAGLLRGIAIGDTELLDPGTVGSFRRAGLSHLVAVSGSNVAIVLGAVGLCLVGTPLVIRLCVAALALVLFVLIVGPDPSVLRAAAMATIALLALASGRRAESMSALAIGLTVVIAVRPGLASSAGLHLSAAATAGIVLWAGPIEKAARRLPRALRIALATTTAAQIAVIPVSVATFGSVSVTGPIANVVAAPAVPLATIVALGAGLLAIPLPAAGAAAARVAEPLAGWILATADVFGAPSWASAQVPRTWAWPAGALAVAGMAYAFVAARSRARVATVRSS